MFGVVVVVFLLFHALPGDPVSLIAGQRSDISTRQSITKELGFWGIEVEEKFGGQGLGMMAKTLVMEEMCKSYVGFSPHGFMLPPDAPNLYYLDACCEGDQRERYFIPYCDRELDSAMAVTEPDAGSDVSGLKTSAVKKGDTWVINGTKTFISKCDKDNVFFILIAVTDKEASTKGKFTAFLICPASAASNPSPST